MAPPTSARQGASTRSRPSSTRGASGEEQYPRGPVDLDGAAPPPVAYEGLPSLVGPGRHVGERPVVPVQIVVNDDCATAQRRLQSFEVGHVGGFGVLAVVKDEVHVANASDEHWQHVAA